MTTAFRARVAAICAPLAGAEVSDPWGGGHDAWKVGGKMFACIGAIAPGVSVKTADPETAAMLIDAGVGHRAAYFHRSWITLPEDTPDDELAHRLNVSYDLVRAKLPKKVQAHLTSIRKTETAGKREAGREGLDHWCLHLYQLSSNDRPTEPTS